MSKLSAIIRLTRIEHSFLLVIAVVAAELIAFGLPSAATFVLSLISPIFISMGSFAINDYFDIKLDKFNRKRERPLVSMELKPAEAIWISAICFSVGILASAGINPICLGIALIFSGLAILYSYKLKEVLLLGNIYIAFTMLIPFIFGSYVVSTQISKGILFVSMMVFLSGLAREVHGTIRDLKGDEKARNLKSLPIVIGAYAASVWALLFYSVAVLISIYLFLTIPPFSSNLFFGIPILISDLMLLYVGIGYLYYQRKLSFFQKTRNISLFAMGIALVAILLAPLVHT